MENKYGAMTEVGVLIMFLIITVALWAKLYHSYFIAPNGFDHLMIVMPNNVSGTKTRVRFYVGDDVIAVKEMAIDDVLNQVSTINRNVEFRFEKAP